MKIKILSQKRNDLLRRREIKFMVVHEKAGTPSRLEVREDIARMMNSKIECVYLRKMETKTGSAFTVGEANIYDTVEQAKSTEPNHIRSRNMPKEKVKGEEE